MNYKYFVKGMIEMMVVLAEKPDTERGEIVKSLKEIIN